MTVIIIICLLVWLQMLRETQLKHQNQMNAKWLGSLVHLRYLCIIHSFAQWNNDVENTASQETQLQHFLETQDFFQWYINTDLHGAICHMQPLQHTYKIKKVAGF